MANRTPQDTFAQVWGGCLEEMDRLGIATARLRKQTGELGALELAHRILTGRRCSDGFSQLQQAGRLDLSVEALAVEGRFGSLFSDQEANEALNRLLEAGYRW